MAFAQDDLLQHMPVLKSFAVSLCRDRVYAEDLVQETVLRALVYQDKFREGSNLRAWLFTILRNTFVGQKRKRKNEVEDAEGALAERLSVAPNQEWYLMAQDLESALNSIPQVQRDSIRHIIYEDIPYAETAEIMQCSLGTVKSRVHRARELICKILDGEVKVENAEAAWLKLERELARTDFDDMPSCIAFEDV